MRNQKIYGCIFGGAYGDAIGKATEFLSPEQVVTSYGTKKITFGGIISDFHRDGWDTTDWTDDTDQAILVMETMHESSVDSCHTVFSSKLHHWVFNGFPELGDNSGVGIGAPVGWAVKSPAFPTQPHSVAEEIWRNTDGYIYEDGAVMRCAVAGCFKKPKTEIFKYTVNICQTTHYDPRCVAACTFIVSCVYDFVNGATDVAKVLVDAENAAVDAIKELKYIHGVDYDTQTYINKFLRYINRAKSISSLSEIDFNKGHSRSNTKYPLYCAIYGLIKVSRGETYSDIIEEIIRRGGDADTNACVAGNLMGAYAGFSAIPTTAFEMKNFFWLKNKVDDILLN